MARRRLHGETQKRRKKRSTKVLKRSTSATRVEATQQAAPFQREGELSGEDVAFLEAMRDMGVRRFPKSGEAPVRQETFAQVQFAAEEEGQNAFIAAMQSLGVRRLPPGKSIRNAPPATGAKTEDIPGTAQTPAAKRPVAPAPPAPQPATGVAYPPRKARSEKDAAMAPPRSAATRTAPPAPSAAPPAPSAARSAPSAAPLAKEIRFAGANAAKERPALVTEPSPRPARGGPNGGAPPGNDPGGGPTTFASESADRELMEAVVRQGEFDPGLKFEGAPRPVAIPAQWQREQSGEPDGELDLHGKTQEQAIHLVQNFLLTSKQQKLREVLIITGKGLNSGADGPVLREAVNRWLTRNGSRFARAFGRAPARHGGDGAIWITLR